MKKIQLVMNSIVNEMTYLVTETLRAQVITKKITCPATSLSPGKFSEL